MSNLFEMMSKMRADGRWQLSDDEYADYFVAGNLPPLEERW